MKWQTAKRKLQNLAKWSLQTNHNRIVTCGCLVGLFYLSTWLSVLWDITRSGSANLVLNAGFIYLGLEALWQQRRSIAALDVVEEERFTGHLLILGGATIFGFSLTSVSLQALSFAVILIGIAYSTWGVRFFVKYPLPSLLLLLSVYPDLGFLAITLWRNLTPPYLLESWMAWLGHWGLRAIGQPATASGQFLSILPLAAGRSVEIASGCNGFDMAFSLAGFTFVLGLFLKLPWKKITILMTIGVGLALIFNVPRIMLLTIAAVYWGKNSFEFWHGPIGGQIFTAILFTAYYYVIMGAIDQKPTTLKH